MIHTLSEYRDFIMLLVIVFGPAFCICGITALVERGEVE